MADSLAELIEGGEAYLARVDAYIAGRPAKQTKEIRNARRTLYWFVGSLKEADGGPEAIWPDNAELEPSATRAARAAPAVPEWQLDPLWVNASRASRQNAMDRTAQHIANGNYPPDATPITFLRWQQDYYASQRGRKSYEQQEREAKARLGGR
jgi:hypothetical protein